MQVKIEIDEQTIFDGIAKQARDRLVGVDDTWDAKVEIKRKRGAAVTFTKKETSNDSNGNVGGIDAGGTGVVVDN